MKKIIYTIVCLLFVVFSNAQISIIDTETEEPVSYASISFGNGNGIYADDKGKFFFSKKLYPDIDSIFISALGYHDLKLKTLNLSKTQLLRPKADELTEVIIHAKPKGKFKEQTIKPKGHNDYFKCWLPTIESEIAVLFKNDDATRPKHITKVHFPIKLEDEKWKNSKRKATGARKFSTLFRVHFYENDNGKPGEVMTYEEILFTATEKLKDVYELDVKESGIYMPKNGMFISVQVLGYMDPKGKLLPNKKYREVKTKKGIVKISTTFRPLLPFTDAFSEKRTFVKRIFLSGNEWVLYSKENVKQKSNLLNQGLNNYGIGLKMDVYEPQ